MDDTTPGLVLKTRWPGDTDIKTPDTSETYENEPDPEATDPINDQDVLSFLAAKGFNVSRLRAAWGDGSALS